MTEMQSTVLLNICLKKSNISGKLWKNIKKTIKKMTKDSTRQKRDNKNAVKDMTHSKYKDTLFENKQMGHKMKRIESTSAVRNIWS